MHRKLTALAAGLVALAPIATAQYRNSASGATFNNQYSAMLDLTRTSNQAFWNAQRAIPTVGGASANGSPANPSTPMPAQLWMGRFVLEATDFPSLPMRILPDQIVASAAGTPQQKQSMRTLYMQFLAQFDGQYRRSNIAVAAAYAIAVSLRVDRGRELSVPEWNQLVARINDTLAATPQFNAMPPQQKQILYESLIITGASAGVLFAQGAQQNELALQLQARELAQSVLKQWGFI